MLTIVGLLFTALNRIDRHSSGRLGSRTPIRH
jgi:hypothetical protein